MIIVLLSRETGSVSSDVNNGSKAREIVGDETGDARLTTIVTNGNEVSCP